MRPVERVEQTKRALAATILTRAALWSACAVIAIGAAGIVVARRTGTSTALAWTLAAIVGATVLAWLAGPFRRLTIPRVALWIEERVPQLEYALVTAVDRVDASDDVARRLDAHVTAISWGAETRSAIAKALARPAGALVIALVAFLAAQRVRVAAATSADATVTSTTDRARTAVAPFARLAAVVRTPAYAGGRVVRIESPASISSLAGSTVAFEAPGNGDDITAELAGERVAIQRAADSWRVVVTLGARPALVRLRHPLGERIISLEPRADSVPSVRLMLPVRDTVMRVAAGSLTLAAETHDDIGLANGGFEYIVSSGEGESFKFRSGTLGTKPFRNASTGTLGAALSLEGLELKPGDMVHLRAVARDGNTVSGPGLGSSETRVLRIARAGEYDSVAVEGAPPPEADKSLLSQRMLIMLTEALEKRRPKLARETFVSEARAIGRDQTRLRKRVGDIIFQRLGDDPTGEHGHDPDEAPADSGAARADSIARDSVRRAALRAGKSAREVAVADSADSARAALLRAASAATGTGEEILDFEGDETPVVAINRPLLEAYNAMWEASRALDQGETGRALPPMRRALEAIQRARQAERIYLRGKAPAVVVDLARVRLTGKDTGGASARVPRSPADPGAIRRASRLATAIEIAGRAPAAAVDSLVLLRVEALDAAPALATAIADALEAMRGGRDAAALLARAARRGRRRAQRRVGRVERRVVSEFVFATAQYESGDWDSAPLVPANLIDSMARYTSLAVAPTGSIVSLSSDDLFRYPLVFLTGHLPVRFTEGERTNLRRYADRGGMLFVDDHNHDIDGAFHKTAVEELGRAVGPLAQLPNTHQLYTSFFKFPDGPPNTAHELNGWGDNLVHSHLLATMRGDRVAVLYSNKDYSSEWGYHPDNKRFLSIDNTKFGVNVIVYALTR